MMNRRWLWLPAAFLLALGPLSGCSDDDDTSEPPQVTIVHPLPGAHLDADPVSVLVEAASDRGINRVEISLDDELLSTLRQAPYTTRLPLGLHADGQPRSLNARAYDTRGQAGDAPPVSITIDPSLQSVPQIVALLPAPGDSGHLRLEWLTWPRPPALFTWQTAYDDGFLQGADGGSLAETMVLVPFAQQSVVYARVKVSDSDGVSGWSRFARYNGLQTWRHRYPLAGSQLGAAVHVASDDGSLLVLVHGAAGGPVARSEVRMLTVDAGSQALQGNALLLDSTHAPTSSLMMPGDEMVLAGRRTAGGSFLAAANRQGLLWSAEPQIMRATALVRNVQGALLAAGSDLRGSQNAGGGGLFAAVTGQGTLAPVAVFPMLPEYEIRRVWVRPDGGFVLAGQVLLGTAETPGGIWVAGLGPLAAGAHELLWTVRLGSAHRWLLCGANTDGLGNFVLAGAGRHTEPASRYGFLVAVDQQGRLRWQVTDRGWQQFADVAVDVGGRWVAAGARRRDLGDQRYEYETALRGLSPFGATLWESVHRAGNDAQAWALARHPHPGGGWYVAGASHGGATGYDVDLLRVDDRGELQ